jgi:uncharacterized protein
MPQLIGNTATLRSLKPQDFTDEQFGLPTVTDILRELEKPGRDPRPAFATASFAEGIETLEDLAPGMVLEGVVTNVAAFGAFVDVGVHQDGLVHVSAMSRGFVSDPREVAKSGDVVRVKVLSVDVPRKRISLTLRLDDDAPGEGGRAGGDRAGGGRAGGGRADGDRERGRQGGGRESGDQPAGGGQERRGQDGARGRDGGRGRDSGGRDSGGRGGGGRGRDGGGRGGDGGSGRDGGRDRGGRGGDTGGGAMAEALRRAGLTGGSGADPGASGRGGSGSGNSGQGGGSGRSGR